jgi:hypothetical protein
MAIYIAFYFCLKAKCQGVIRNQTCLAMRFEEPNPIAKKYCYSNMPDNVLCNIVIVKNMS